jgi:acid phosphatase (class A)
MFRNSSLATATVALCLALLATATFLAPTAAAQSAAPPAPAGNGMPRPRAEGYLGAGQLPDHLVFLPPPPAVESPAGTADVAIFHATRSLEGGPRWQLATSDDRINSRKMLGDFGCAMGVDLAAVEAPALARTLARANADLIGMVGAAKDHYRRPRPFVTESGPICVNVSPEFAARQTSSAA